MERWRRPDPRNMQAATRREDAEKKKAQGRQDRWERKERICRKISRLLIIGYGWR